jgi:hypothetical protein
VSIVSIIALEGRVPVGRCAYPHDIIILLFLLVLLLDESIDLDHLIVLLQYFPSFKPKPALAAQIMVALQISTWVLAQAVLAVHTLRTELHGCSSQLLRYLDGFGECGLVASLLIILIRVAARALISNISSHLEWTRVLIICGELLLHYLSSGLRLGHRQRCC